MTQPKVMPKLSAGDPASVILPQSKPTTGRSKSLSRLPSKLQPSLRISVHVDAWAAQKKAAAHPCASLRA